MPVDSRPRINDPIVLRDDDRAYRSRVEDVGPDRLTVARPLDLPTEHAPVVGAEMLVTWSCPRGIAVLPTRLLDVHAEGGLALWSMAITGDGWVEQRRRFVRVPVGGSVTLRPRDAEPAVGTVTGHLLDVSEAALRCTVDAATADDTLVDDVEVTVGFRLGDREFAIPARIGFRRPSARPTELAELVVLFDEPVTDADALRKQVFDQQLRNRRAGSGG
jgi:c-di-GMP-binding flagellar brake protein YcgR